MKNIITVIILILAYNAKAQLRLETGVNFEKFQTGHFYSPFVSGSFTLTQEEWQMGAQARITTRSEARLGAFANYGFDHFKIQGELDFVARLTPYFFESMTHCSHHVKQHRQDVRYAVKALYEMPLSGKFSLVPSIMVQGFMWSQSFAPAAEIKISYNL